MKKLFSLILVALISSQMWAYKVYYGYGYGSNSTQGKYLCVKDNSSTYTIPAANNSNWKTASASSSNYISPTNSNYVHCAALANTGYKFKGWYKVTNNTNSSNCLSTANPYTFQTNSKDWNVYAVFEVDATPEPTVLTAPGVVDLGLSVLWADRNLGASTSSESGYYYAWGEIEPKSNYVSDGYSNPYTTFSDANDVARQKLGNNWRMPTYTEVSELVNSTSCSYTSSGVTITGNGASIYIPRAGYMNGTTKTATDRVWLWTRSYYDNTQAKIIFAQSNSCISASNYYSCYCGLPVRAVYVGTTVTATFKDGNNSTVKTQKVIPGTAPTAPATATKTATAQYTYTFTGWSPAVGNISSNTTYTAQFSSTTRSYTITFNNYNGSQLQSTSVNYGVAPSYSGTPTRAADEDYTYEFSGWTDGVNDYAVGTTLPTVTGAKTYTATFTATPKTPAYVTATFNNYDNSLLQTVDNVVSGTTPEYTGATPTKPSTQTVSEVTTYSFTGWSPALGAITTNTTYTAQFSSSTSPRQYLIRFLMDDGSTVIQSDNVAYGETPIAPANEDVTKIADESYTYAFAGWDANNDGVVDGVAEVTGAQDYKAVFTATPKVVVPTYNITVGAYSNGTVTLTAGGNVQVVPAEGGVYNYLEGTTIIVKATANRGFHFTEWSDHTTNPSVRVREIDENKTLTPTFAANTPFTMLDTWNEAACNANYDKTNVLTVTLDGRTFTAGQWATLSVPFDYTLTAEDALYNMVYRLSLATLSQSGNSMSFEFVRTNAIEANQPYLVVPRQAINEVVFDGVKLETPAEEALTTDNRVAFVSSLWMQTIRGRNEFYVGANSTLRYASTTGTTVKGNRAFFRKIGDAASAPRRAIFVIDGEEREVEIADDAIEEVQNVRKYMENGVLIIERNGVRFNAQGQR